MKRSLKLLVAGLLCCVAAKAGAFSSTSVVAVTIIPPTTNLVQSLNLTLTIYSQGDTITNGSVITEPVVKMKKTTKDLIQILGTATTNTFSTSAKLMMATPLPEGESQIYVQDGTNKVDVSGFFSGDDGQSVSAYSTNTVSHIEKETSYGIFRLRLNDRDADKIALHFDLRGFSTTTSASIVKNNAILGKSHQIAANLAGEGSYDDGTGSPDDFVIQGTLTVTGNTLVVTP